MRAHPLIGDEKASPEARQQMRERTTEGQRWAAYENVAMDSTLLGGLQFPGG